jgi:hypothetical protein
MTDFQPEFAEFLKLKVVTMLCLKYTFWSSFGIPEVLSGFSASPNAVASSFSVITFYS